MQFQYNPLTGNFDLINESADSSGSLRKKQFTADGVKDDFIADFTLDSNYMVFVNGILQSAGYSRAADTITFTAAPANGSTILICN